MKPPAGFVLKRLPWLLAAAVLVVYLATIGPWVRLESLAVVAKATGWDWMPAAQGPLQFVVTYPVRWLPPSWQPVCLSIMAAVFSAVAIGFLARSVSLLPFDRTREERMRERNEDSLLSLPLKWVPVVFAALVCAFQLSYWEHATSATGEALDLLLFAWAALCLIEYRLDRRECRLNTLALIYGLAVTNNYAMIALFPCFLIALIWIKGFEFFQWKFIGRMVVLGVAGLSLYLVLPLVAVVGGQTTQTFWQFLRMELGNQRLFLAGFPPWIVLLLSFTSLFPLFIRSIRWPSPEGDINIASLTLATVITRVVHVLLLAASLSVFFDPRWSARVLGSPLPLLPFYYLSALGVGWFSGYFLLMGRTIEGRGWHRRPGAGAFLSKLSAWVVLAAAAASPVIMVVRNLPQLRDTDGRHVAELSRLMVQGFPKEPAFVIGDTFAELLLAEGMSKRESPTAQHVFVNSRLLDFHVYHERLSSHYFKRWPTFPNKEALPEPIDAGVLSDVVAYLAATNKVYYLHPSMGFFFESLRIEPHGLIYRLVAVPTNSAPPILTAAEITENQKFWNGARPELSAVAALVKKGYNEARFVGQIYSRALNQWGAMLQRAGKLDQAAWFFATALEVNPDNVPAKVNVDFNKRLKKGPLTDYDLNKPIEVSTRQRWDDLLLANGPFDEPSACLRVGQVYAQGGLFRQALTQFERVAELLPGNTAAIVWQENMKAMMQLASGQTETAENMVLSLKQKYPKEDSVLETLQQIYMRTKKFAEALTILEEQLQLNPSNERALLNKAVMCIHTKAFDKAVAAMDKLLSLQPDHPAALMNRAIANLQSDRLDNAKRDYEALLKQLPKYSAVHYGLAEVAYRRKDAKAALGSYQKYLEYARPGTAEYKEVEQRIKELKAGSAGR